MGRSLVAGDPPVGAATYLLVPTGRIDVVIGDPITKVPSEQSRDLKDHRAPRGSVFIPVWLKFTNEASGHPLMSSKPQETASREAKPLRIYPHRVGPSRAGYGSSSAAISSSGG